MTGPGHARPDDGSDGAVADGDGPAARYWSAYDPAGPHGHAVRLFDKDAPAGMVLDLGCGYAAVAEVLVGRGRCYAGVDRDTCALADLRRRGLEAEAVDLAVEDGLVDRLEAVIAGRPLAAVLVLDVLEHLPEPGVLLAALGRLCAERAAAGSAAPLLVASIPNVAHFDLGAKLVAGRFDVTETGLLDRTHLQLFTERRVEHELGRHGWHECARDDVVLERSDQWFPDDHPLLSEGAPAHDFLRAVRAAADPSAFVNQFVRSYRHGEPRHAEVPGAESGVLLTAVCRATAGGDGLQATLAALAGQRLRAFEVVVVADVGASPAACRAALAGLGPSAAARVRLEPDDPEAPDVAVALERGLRLATGRHVAFVDEGDLVPPDWAERLAAAARRGPGRVLRTGPGSFDAVAELTADPPGTEVWAIPRVVLDELGLGVDEHLARVDGRLAARDLCLRAALLVGVEDVSGTRDGGSDEGRDRPGMAPGDRAELLAGLDRSPLLLPAGSASSLARLARELEQARAEAAELRRRLEVAAERAERAEHARDELERSEFWRLTAPLRGALDRLRALARREP